MKPNNIDLLIWREITLEFEQRWKDKYPIFLYLTNSNASQICMSSLVRGHIHFLCTVPSVVFVLLRQTLLVSLSSTINFFLSWGTDLIGFVGKEEFKNHHHFISAAALQVLLLLRVYSTTPQISPAPQYPSQEYNLPATMMC